ncbi:MAG: NAD(P)/FAD-dependent oxidoreductase [Firmicutes bacterium]|nr:NAD(P)/FAD-dependent oxidoreductase [Bacillota bacterium]
MADTVVVGGGAAGALAACVAAERGRRVLLLEPNRDIGRKLRITGKGRCNLTNLCEPREFLESVPQGGKFLYSALNGLSPQATIEMFESMGVSLKVERGRRVFPASDDAGDVAAALVRRLRAACVEIRRIKAAGLRIEGGAVCAVRTVEGELPCESALIATGGLSYPGTGSTGDGYAFARAAGHAVSEPRPSLVPLVAQGTDCSKLQGLSLRNVKLTAYEDGKTIYAEQGELLFTHFGLSGPLALSASAHMRRFGERRYSVSIDLKPALDEGTLDRRLLADFARRPNSDFINALDALLPQKLIPVAVARSGVDPRIKVNTVTRAQRASLLQTLKNFAVEIRGPRPIAEAIITSGGVGLGEVNPRTMESKLVRGLYFAGEVLDLDAYTGGYNLQIAWSTGYAAGMNL